MDPASNLRTLSFAIFTHGLLHMNYPGLTNSQRLHQLYENTGCLLGDLLFTIGTDGERVTVREFHATRMTLYINK